MPEDSSTKPAATPIVETPLPQEAGSEGTQSLPPDGTNQSLAVVGPIGPTSAHVGAALGEHVDPQNPTLVLAYAAYRDADTLRQAVMSKWKQTEDEKDKAREECHEQRRRNAVLTERLKIGNRLKRFQSALLTLGGLVGGSGLSAVIVDESLAQSQGHS